LGDYGTGTRSTPFFGDDGAYAEVEWAQVTNAATNTGIDHLLEPEAGIA
jgi:hypothetical protein